MEEKRWQQRFSDFQKAFNRLNEGLKNDNLEELEKDGIIQRFEFTFELAWKTLKDYCQIQGFSEVATPKKSIQKAFELGLIKNDEIWVEILGDRNRMSHLYNQSESQQIFENIRDKYIEVFEDLIKSLKKETK